MSVPTTSTPSIPSVPHWIGDRDVHGHEGVRFGTLKALTQRWPREAGCHAEFAMPTMT